MTVELTTGYEPHQYQLATHERVKRFNVLVCHRRWGKTVFAVNQLIHDALSTDGGIFLYIAPYLKQARAIAWDLILSYAAHIPGVEANRSEGVVKFPTGSKILMAGSDNDQALRGLGITGVICDEIADFRPETWPEVIRPALSADPKGRKGWVVFIGTPKGQNQFSELYEHAMNDPEWYAGLYRADETDLPWLDDAELGLARAAMSDNQYRQEFLCDFTASADNMLITIDVDSAAAHRHVDRRMLKDLPRVIGVDVARFGDDRSVIQKRQGLAAEEPIVFDDIDNMTLAASVAWQIKSYSPDAVFIDAGRGEGVIDRLRQLGHTIQEVDFGGRATSNRYANRRSEMWDRMAEWLNQGGTIPNDPALKSDLCTPSYGFDAANRLRLETKDKIKERGMRSPDLGDSLALTFASPVTPHRRPIATAGRQAVHDYDPLEAA